MAPGTTPGTDRRAPQRAPNAARAIAPAKFGTPFHEGERAVQRRAGTEQVAAQIGRSIASFVPAEFGDFLGRAALCRSRRPEPPPYLDVSDHR